LLIEALKPLRVMLAGGAIELRPGVPVEMDDCYAEKLLAKRPDAVRAVLTPSRGESWVTWRSPLFSGELKGRVLMPPSEGKVLVDHPITEQPVYIPMAWLIEKGGR
jgi:hypothetical protein